MTFVLSPKLCGQRCSVLGMCVLENLRQASYVCLFAYLLTQHLSIHYLLRSALFSALRAGEIILSRNENVIERERDRARMRLRRGKP